MSHRLPRSVVVAALIAGCSADSSDPDDVTQDLSSGDTDDTGGWALPADTGSDSDGVDPDQDTGDAERPLDTDAPDTDAAPEEEPPPPPPPPPPPEQPVPDPAEPPASEENAAATEAAALRARLTTLYAEHVYLVGIASKTAREGGDNGAAAQSMDANTAAIAAEMAAMYGSPVGARYEAVWRSMTRHELAYSAARARGDEASAAQEEAAAAADARESVAIVDAANPRLEPGWLREWTDLLVVDTLLLLDIEETHPTAQYDRYSWTVRKTQVIGQILAAVYDELNRIPGDPDVDAANLRAHVAWLYVDNTYQCALMTWAELGVGDAFAARKYLDEQSTARLVRVVTDAYGADAGDAFAGAWRAQIDAIREYADVQDRGGDVAAARTRVDGAAQGVVSALSGIVPTLDAGAFRAALQARNEALLAGADAQARGGSWTGEARVARAWALAAADLMVVAIYEHQPGYRPPDYGP